MAAQELILQYNFDSSVNTDLDITSIPQTYRHLEVIVAARNNNTNSYWTCNLYPNQSTSSDKWHQSMYSSGATAYTDYDTTASTYKYGISGGNYVTGYHNFFKWFIYDYTNTVTKPTCTWRGGYQHFNGWNWSNVYRQGFGSMDTTSAVTSLRLTGDGGGSNYWDAGSKIYLVGWNDYAGA